jgi:alpha-tubulin suppressor-like RCC1 family protein
MSWSLTPFRSQRERPLEGRTIAVLCVASVLAAAAATLGGAAAQASISSPSQADHWGYFFGDHLKKDTDEIKSPEQMSLPAPIAQLGTSNSTEYALLTNGELWAWGQGTHGELGDGRDANSFTVPVQVLFPRGVTIAYVPIDAMPFDTALAVDTQGNAWGWGFNQSGELCLGNQQSHDIPQRLPLSAVTALAGADGHAVFDSGGTVYSCGRNNEGGLGTGKKASSKVPVRVKGLPAGVAVTALVSSWENAGALLANGDYYDWGYDGAGQLGNGTINTSSDVPVRVSLPGPVDQVAEGGSSAANGQSIVMLADGSLYAWGNDTWSQLGDHGIGRQPSPVRIFPPANVTYAAIASGGASSYAIDTAGKVWAWGKGSRGELGDGTTQNSATPVMADSGTSMISSTAGNVAVAGGTSAGSPLTRLR